jgi:hypothetical protein
LTLAVLIFTLKINTFKEGGICYKEVSVKVVKNLDEFYRINDKDVENILNRFFSNILKYHNLEDLKFEIYERLLKKKYIEKYRPLEITVDEEELTWYVKPNHAKFSTYICKFIFNYIYAYYSKIKQDNLCLSLEEFNDSNYSEEFKTKANTLFLFSSNADSKKLGLIDFSGKIIAKPERFDAIHLLFFKDTIDE